MKIYIDPSIPFLAGLWLMILVIVFDAWRDKTKPRLPWWAQRRTVSELAAQRIRRIEGGG